MQTGAGFVTVKVEKRYAVQMCVIEPPIVEMEVMNGHVIVTNPAFSFALTVKKYVDLKFAIIKTIAAIIATKIIALVNKVAVS
ncbi:MAG: hypothetical protein QXO76_02980 [Thermoproteota archaeon]